MLNKSTFPNGLSYKSSSCPFMLICPYPSTANSGLLSNNVGLVIVSPLVTDTAVSPDFR